MFTPKQENPNEIVIVIFHDGHEERMTLARLQRLPYDHQDNTEYGAAERTFALGFRHAPDDEAPQGPLW